jgi:hypothetical protein
MLPASALARATRVVVLCALCLALSGCGKSKITKENFDKIKENEMTLKDVEAILGEGTSQGGDGANVAAQVGVDVSGGVGAQQSPGTEYVWEKGDKSITVTIRGGKVVHKRSKGL